MASTGVSSKTGVAAQRSHVASEGVIVIVMIIVKEIWFVEKTTAGEILQIMEKLGPQVLIAA